MFKLSKESMEKLNEIVEKLSYNYDFKNYAFSNVDFSCSCGGNCAGSCSDDCTGGCSSHFTIG